MTVRQFLKNLSVRIQGDNNCWVYIHLPKTAGSSLTHAFRRHFGRERAGGVFRFRVLQHQQSMERMLRRRYRVIGGHLGRLDIERLEAAWPNVRFRYFTFLRDPVSRFISAYQHGLRDGFVLPKPAAINLESDSSLLSGLYNTQARQLAYGYHISDLPSGTSNELILSRATETLRRCEFIGLYESLNDEIERLYALMQIGEVPILLHRNSTKNVIFEFDSEDMDRVRALTSLDAQLYNSVLSNKLGLPRR